MRQIDDPVVSVIIPTRNRRWMLARAMSSVVAQSFSEWELIVVDDASTDGTDVLVAEWVSRDPRIRTVRNAVPCGGSGARNAGVSRARGEFVAFLDDDDSWLPEKLEKQLRLLQDNAAAVAASCWFAAVYPWGKRLVRTADDPSLEHLLAANTLGGASVCLVRRKSLEQAGGFSDNLPSAQDWDVWVKLRRLGPIVTVHQPLVTYAVHRDAKISTDLEKKYLGFRRFFLKYRSLMSKRARYDMMSVIAFNRSRAASRFRFKLRWLMRSLVWAHRVSRKAGFLISVLCHWKDQR